MAASAVALLCASVQLGHAAPVPFQSVKARADQRRASLEAYRSTHANGVPTKRLTKRVALRASGSRGADRGVDWSRVYRIYQLCGTTRLDLCQGDAFDILREYPVESSGARRPRRPAGPSRAQVESLVERAVLSMKLPLPAPRLGPDPSVNEWNMAVVGYPLWLWVDADQHLSTATTAGPIPLRLNASLDRVTFNMGDGRQVTCRTMHPYRPSVKPATPSPSCGHVYERASLPKGAYRVEATAHWVIRWSALGMSGSMPATTSAERSVRVGELQAVITG